MTQIFVGIISAISAIIVAVIELLSARSRKEFQKNLEEEEVKNKARLELSIVNSKMVKANGDLTVIIAKKLLNKKTNGDVEEAMTEYTNSVRELNDVEEKIVNKLLN